ncbi:MAG: DUF1816 domain-containing protein [Cyanobacteria bacterium J06629_9]
MRSVSQDWWIEMVTASPQCVYFFGPFETIDKAACAEAGYTEDLNQEGAKVVKVTIEQRSTPGELTVLSSAVAYMPGADAPYSGTGA